jgi:hypothetical protein
LHKSPSISTDFHYWLILVFLRNKLFAVIEPFAINDPRLLSFLLATKFILK